MTNQTIRDLAKFIDFEFKKRGYILLRFGVDNFCITIDLDKKTRIWLTFITFSSLHSKYLRIVIEYTNPLEKLDIIKNHEVLYLLLEDLSILSAAWFVDFLLCRLKGEKMHFETEKIWEVNPGEFDNQKIRVFWTKKAFKTWNEQQSIK